MRDVLIGFDSAWTDSSKNPGAIAAYILEGKQYATFEPPRNVTFRAAVHFIREVTTEADYVLIAIDQPTLVPNYDGSRPVDRVAGSLISRLRAGVQPARQGGIGAPMFGEGAPIWSFLAAVEAKQNPIEARSAATGRFLMEVFPALALPAIVPVIWQRARAAKYNPGSVKFDPEDWRIVASGLASFARSLGADDLADWAEKSASLGRPRKADQDQLDAAICLAIALGWRNGPVSGALVIGDEQTGYMATLVSVQTRSTLVKAAAERRVAIDREWEGSLGFSVAAMPTLSHRNVAQPRSSVPRAVSVPISRNKPARVDLAMLRGLLIERARSGAPITYSEVATALGHRWSQGFGASLVRALDALFVANEDAGEPSLMCLVVNRKTGLPGKGFYKRFHHGGADDITQRNLFAREVERCRGWSWR